MKQRQYIEQAKWRTSWAHAILLIMVFAGCQSKFEPRRAEVAGRPTIGATNAFVEYVARRLVADEADVVFPVDTSADPADWDPTPEALEIFQQADLVVLNGATYEKWVANVALPATKLVRSANVFREAWIEEQGVVHSHGPGGEHSHAGVAITTWIDFDQARQQATAIRDGLIKLMPESVESIRERFQQLDNDLQRLDERMTKVATKIAHEPLVVSHPVYQYWTRRYNLNTRAVHWEPAERPPDEDIEALRKLLKEHPAKVMIWEGPPSDENLALVSGLGLTNLVFAPCGKKPAASDWLQAMQSNIDSLERHFTANSTSFRVEELDHVSKDKMHNQHAD